MRHGLTAAPRDIAGENDRQRKNRIAEPSARGRVADAARRHHARKNRRESELRGDSQLAPAAMQRTIRSVIRSAVVPLTKKSRRVSDMMMVNNRARLEPRNSLRTQESLDAHRVGAPATLVEWSHFLPQNARITHDCRRQVGSPPGVTARKPPGEFGHVHAELP